MAKKTRIGQYFERVTEDQLTGGEILMYGDYFKVPTKGTTDVLQDCGTCFKYDFGKQVVQLCDVKGRAVFEKQVDLALFVNKQWNWLNLMKREARLMMNLDEEASDAEEPKVYLKKYYGYLDEDGDVIDMRNAAEDGTGAVISSFDQLNEESDNYRVDEEGDIYLLYEAQLPKVSNPQEGFIYWDKGHKTAYYVVAVYPKQKDEAKQVSYWNDEGKRKTCSIADFKKNMVPSNDIEDYDIFEECEIDGDDTEDLDEEVKKSYDKNDPAVVFESQLSDEYSLKLKLIKKLKDGDREFYELRKNGKTVGEIVFDYFNYTEGLMIEMKKDGKTGSVQSFGCGDPSKEGVDFMKSTSADIKKNKSKIEKAAERLEAKNVNEDLDEELAVVSGVTGKTFTVYINGKKYTYTPNSDTGFSSKDLKEKFDAMAKHNMGRALAWLKKNATTKDSYRKKAANEEAGEDI